MEEYKRNSIMMQLDDYCIMAKEHDYIEVTEWSNGEGFDIMIEVVCLHVIGQKLKG